MTTTTTTVVDDRIDELKEGDDHNSKKKKIVDDDLMYDPAGDEKIDRWIRRNVLKKTEWYYLTDKGIQGPFNSEHMRRWNREGWFVDSLMVARTIDAENGIPEASEFVPLGTLGSNPFASSNDPLRRTVVLNCPSCFVPVSFVAKLDRGSKTDYVAQASVNCVVNNREKLQNTAVASAETLHPLECATCGTELGTYNPRSRCHRFMDVIPGF